MTSRVERVADIRRLSKKGATRKQIAGILGVSLSTISDYLADPDGFKARARKASYGGECEICGKTTSGSNGRSKAPKRCIRHAAEAHTVFDEDAIIILIKAFAEMYGRPPTALDWNPNMARRLGHYERAERFYEDGCWPGVNLVQGRFGTWNNAIRAAGFKPMRPGTKLGDGIKHYAA